MTRLFSIKPSMTLKGREFKCRPTRLIHVEVNESSADREDGSTYASSHAGAVAFSPTSA
jgi:hypothetical protein